ncbi:MAG TPA: patatin-like phospholipase family protein [Beijerinckiaceae bacterium]|nr:patatin-like phospholipase family protein [Beijerinckiaceae bacterium]
MSSAAAEPQTDEKLCRDDVFTTDRLLEAEAHELGHPKELTALCLSGGGIRSAAFALGVVQALARKGLLPHFHYLSTVSGGGYLGAWLSRWIEEEKRALTNVAASATQGNATSTAATAPPGDGAAYRREIAPGAKPNMPEAQGAECSALLNVQAALAGRDSGTGAEPPPIRWLRENSNFITPRIGLASADTWTAIAMSVRNVLINWLVFLPALLVAAAIPNLGASLLVVSSGWFADLCLIVGILLIGLASYKGAYNLPSHLPPGDRRDGGYVFSRVVAPAALGAAALAGGVAPHLLAPDAAALDRPFARLLHQGWFTFLTDKPLVAETLEVAFACAFLGMVGGYLVAAAAASRVARLGASNRKGFVRNFPLWLGGAAFAAAFYVAGLAMVPRVPCPAGVSSCGLRVDVLATLAVFWGILAQLVVTIVFVAFRWVGRDQKLTPDLDREWLARLSAQKLRVAIAWTLFAGPVLLLWHLVVWLFVGVAGEGGPNYPVVVQWLTGAVGAVSGLAAALGGKARRDATSWTERLLSSGVVLSVATFVSLLFLLLLMGRAEFGLAAWLAGYLAGSWSLALAHVVVLAVVGWVLWKTSSYVKVNRFSLNGLYRNRLTKTFLGAARTVRPDADPFTGFAPSDNIRLHALRAEHPVTGHRVLMPVINVALNLVGGSRLAWQERKAQAFVFTPLACGSAALGDLPEEPWDARLKRLVTHARDVIVSNDARRRALVAARKSLRTLRVPRIDREPDDAGGGRALSGPMRAPESEPAGRYIASTIYGGNEPDLGLNDIVAERGVSLGTAVAISGAAASPSMGYHSSAPTAFLMTLFNVRLGAWLPNPARTDLPQKAMMSSGPPNALLPLIRELLGLTNAQGTAVYLSDGGHFENLGLYEMVRRRCRYIVVSDAGCDPAAAFADLGNAIRKIRIDLGVEIRIETVRIAARDKWDEKSSTYFALGTIKYPGQTPDGDLLYIKPSCAAGVPSDVRAYALASKDFPHESTADQWFSESQFESYRSLGASLVEWLPNPKAPFKSYAKEGLEGFFKDLRDAAAKPAGHEGDRPGLTADGLAGALANLCKAGPPPADAIIRNAPSETR